MRARRPSPAVFASLAVAATIAIAHLPYLLGLSDPNPLGPRSGLAVDVRPGVMSGQPTIDPNNGFTSQAFGHRAALDWLHGKVPWWNPFEGAGGPLAGEMQGAAFFPLTLLLVFPGGQLLEHMVLEWIAGLATYFLLRRLGVRDGVAIAAGIAFSLNGTFAWFQHAPANVVAFLPMLVLGIERAAHAARERRPGGWLVIALALALSIVAGFPESAYINGLLAGAWAVWRLVDMPAEPRAAFVRKVAGAGATAALLAAPATVAFLGYLPHAYASVHTGHGFANSHMPLPALSAVVLPYVFGPIFGFNGYARGAPFLGQFWGNAGGYLSAAVVPLALAGLVGRRHRGLRAVLGGWIGLSLGATFGVGAASWLVYHLPGMTKVAFYRYAHPSWEFAAIVLAALGVEDLGTRPRRYRSVAFSGGIALVLAVLAFRGAWPEVRRLHGAPHHVGFAVGSLVWAVVVMVAVSGGLVFARRIGVAVVCAALAVDAVLMFGLPTLSAPRSVVVDAAPVTWLQQHLGTSRFATLGPISPNYGSYWSIAEVNNNDVPIPAPWRRYVNQRLDPNVDPVIFVGSADGRPASAPTASAAFVDHLDGYRDASVRYVVTTPGQAFPGVDALRLAFTGRAAWIYALDGARPYFDADPALCHVSAVSRTRATTSCRAPTVVIRRELQLPGWRATVNGRAVKIERAGAFQQLSLPAGEAVVRFSYVPPYGREALLAGAGGVAIVAVGIGRRLRRRRTESGTAGDSRDPA